ncbi:hypothetical protein LTR37_006467 [Vermiconidia calcicola]|uniref:Uncharacterized protein n=1 Tax=Vermiconidia calcicola TaxID=1690605 RepID=A0ACC3NG97_9PEZI|nr:hypothetical protein LTR37_006467 [Vermiconidia calcicola]
MWGTIALTDHGRALTASFAALCLARTGNVLKDVSIMKQGRTQYAVALQSLQQALYDPVLAFQDRTLAAIRTLSIYEHLAPTFARIPASNEHEVGMAQWCCAAGPTHVSSEYALQVFEDVRWCIMNRSIQRHESSKLGTREWKTLPWQHYPKDSLQELYDLGFDLAALLEQVDSNINFGNTDAQIRKMEHLSLGCLKVSKNLEHWYTCNWASQGRGQSDANDDLQAYGLPLSDQPLRPELGGLWQGMNIIYYWCFKLILNGILSSLLQQTQQQEELIASVQELDLSSDIFSNGQAYDGSLPTPSSGGFPQKQEQLANDSLKLAIDIVLVSPFFLADDTGWLGPQRYFFPLQKAMEHLSKVGSPFHSDAKAAFVRLITRLRAC